MGARLFRAGNHRRDQIEVFDYTSTLNDGGLLKSVQAPSCLDELIDWTICANSIMRDMQDTVQMHFLPFVKASSVRDEHRNLPSINQNQLAPDFLESSAFDRSTCNAASILIVAETTPYSAPGDIQQMKSVLSLSDFIAYFILLRRYSELMDVGRPPLLMNVSDIPECGICMGEAEEIVLPCLHSMCSSCATKWVDAHGKCPFCRYHYIDRRRMEKDQWQHWSPDSLENDICNLESRLKSFLYKRSTYLMVSPDEWKPLQSVDSTTAFIEPIDCILVG